MLPVKDASGRTIKDSAAELYGESITEEIRNDPLAGLKVISAEKKVKNLGLSQNISSLGASFTVPSMDGIAKGLVGSFYENDPKNPSLDFAATFLEDNAKRLGLSQGISLGDSVGASWMNDVAKGSIGSAFQDDFRNISLDLAATSLEENAKRLGLSQDISFLGASIAALSMTDMTKDLIGSSFVDGLKKISIGSSLESKFGELIKSAHFAGLLETSFETDMNKWRYDVPKLAPSNSFSEVQVKPLSRLRLIKPEIIEFEMPDLPPISAIAREVTLSEETIERLAKKISEKGSNVIVIAKDKGIAIVGDASGDIINTGDNFFDKNSE